MDLTRATIIEIASKEKFAKKILLEYQRGEISEDKMLSSIISMLYKEFVCYREESISNDSITW